MTSFTRLERNPTTSMEHRLALLQQPCELFRPFFDGRTPTLSEKMLYVEQAVQQMISLTIYENDLYHVEINYAPPFLHLDICPRDGKNAKNWRELQQSKTNWWVRSTRRSSYSLRRAGWWTRPISIIFGCM